MAIPGYAGTWHSCYLSKILLVLACVFGGYDQLRFIAKDFGFDTGAMVARSGPSFGQRFLGFGSLA